MSDAVLSRHGGRMHTRYASRVAFSRLVHGLTERLTSYPLNLFSPQYVYVPRGRANVDLTGIHAYLGQPKSHDSSQR